MAKTIEIVNFRLKPEASDEAFVAETQSMEANFLGKLPGFVDRDTGKSEDGKWLVVLHWDSAEDAQASISKFVDAEETRDFTSLIDMETFTMTRYELRDHYQ